MCIFRKDYCLVNSMVGYMQAFAFFITLGTHSACKSLNCFSVYIFLQTFFWSRLWWPLHLGRNLSSYMEGWKKWRLGRDCNPWSCNCSAHCSTIELSSHPGAAHFWARVASSRSNMNCHRSDTSWTPALFKSLMGHSKETRNQPAPGRLDSSMCAAQ